MMANTQIFNFKAWIFLPFIIVFASSSAFSSEPTIMIVAGHVADPRNKPNTVGAKSYRGVDEYQFNDELLALFSESKNQIRGVNYHLLFATENVELRARSRLANTRLPTLYLEIHHDAARRIDREKATAAGVDSALWNPIQGFSVHYSTDSEEAILSRRFARLLGKTMAESGFIPNQYLANIVRMKIEDREIGLYNRVRPHGLYIFRAIKVPVVVLEAGNIAHPREETRLSEEYTRLKVVESINQAIIRYLSGE